MSSTLAERAFSEPPSLVGRSLLSLPEDQWLERKSARVSARDLANTLIGFANADGGLVVVGLHDGEVEGINGHPVRQNEHLQANLDISRPVVQRELAELKEAGVIEWIGKSPRDPRAYWRLAPT